MEVITQGAISKKAVSSVDFHLMQDVLTYGGLFDRLANAATDEEMDQIGREMQTLEKEKLPAFYSDAREYHFELLDILSLIESKIRRLEEAKAGFERVLDRHDDAIHKTMTMLGTKKVQLEVGSFTRRKSGRPKVEIENENEIPSRFKKFTVEMTGLKGHTMTEAVKKRFPEAVITSAVVKEAVREGMEIVEKIVDGEKVKEATKRVPGARLGEETESLMVK